MVLSQPPLPSLDASKTPTSGLKADRAKEILIPTERWVKAEVPITKSKVRGMWVDVHQEAEGSVEAIEAEKWWPRIVPWRVGVWLEGVEMTIQTLETWEG